MWGKCTTTLSNSQKRCRNHFRRMIYKWDVYHSTFVIEWFVKEIYNNLWVKVIHEIKAWLFIKWVVKNLRCMSRLWMWHNFDFMNMSGVRYIIKIKLILSCMSRLWMRSTIKIQYNLNFTWVHYECDT